MAQPYMLVFYSRQPVKMRVMYIKGNSIKMRFTSDMYIKVKSIKMMFISDRKKSIKMMVG